MHFNLASANAVAIEIELHVGMVGEQRHRNGGVRNSFGNHQGGQPQAKWIVMVPRVPNGNLFRFPRFDRANRNGFTRHPGNVSSAGSAGILHQSHRMQIDHAGVQLAKLFRCRRIVFVNAFQPRRIIESLMLDLPLPALHDGTANPLPTGPVFGRVRFGKVKMFLRHGQIGIDAVKAQLAVGALKG